MVFVAFGLVLWYNTIGFVWIALEAFILWNWGIRERIGEAND